MMRIISATAVALVVTTGSALAGGMSYGGGATKQFAYADAKNVATQVAINCGCGGHGGHDRGHKGGKAPVVLQVTGAAGAAVNLNLSGGKVKQVADASAYSQSRQLAVSGGPIIQASGALAVAANVNAGGRRPR